MAAAAARDEIGAVRPREDAAALVADLRRALPSAEVAYWIQPVLTFGRFA